MTGSSVTQCQHTCSESSAMPESDTVLAREERPLLSCFSAGLRGAEVDALGRLVPGVLPPPAPDPCDLLPALLPVWWPCDQPLAGRMRGALQQQSLTKSEMLLASCLLFCMLHAEVCMAQCCGMYYQALLQGTQREVWLGCDALGSSPCPRSDKPARHLCMHCMGQQERTGSQ